MELEKIVNEVKVRLMELEKKRIPIEASGRHLHLSKEDAEKLFGIGYELRKKKDLSQTGQFASEERVRLVGPKGIIDGVIVLGPYRKQTQIEISISDARILGIKPVLRESGNISNTPGIIITNGTNVIKLNEGVIVAKNHIHMASSDAKNLNVKDKEIVRVKVFNTERPITFDDVIVRIDESFKLNMHIDYDEANCCMLTGESYGEIL